MDNFISIKGLSKRFGSNEVLRNIDLDIPRGKVTVIMGLSGTGKSVLLKHILGLMKPDQGDLVINGVDLLHASRAKRGELLREMGMCYQSSALFDSMTAWENVAFPMREHLHMKEEDIESRVDEVLALVGLAKLGREKFPAELSGGMKKRVGLARALVLEPQLVLFDEPTTGLDPVLADLIGQTILSTKEKLGYTCLIVSHDLKLVFDIADIVALLLNGEIRFYGTTEEFRNCTDPAVQQFIAGKAGDGPIEVQ